MEGNRTVLVVTDNLFFLPRIQIAATAAGMTSLRVANRAEFDEASSAGDAAFVLIDLETDRETWRDIVTVVKTGPGTHPSVIAYGPHEAEDLMAEARDIGCDTVLARGAFVNRLLEMFSARDA